MFLIKHVNSVFSDLSCVEELYEHSFPANERRSLDTLVKDISGVSEFLAFYKQNPENHENVFIGFMSLLKNKDIVHIIYFAVAESLRGQGMGSQMLGAIAERFPGKRIIADLERPIPHTKTEALRLRRMDFYHRNGFEKTDVTYNWRGEEYIILSHGGSITEEEFNRFWDAIDSIDPRFSDY